MSATMVVCMTIHDRSWMPAYFAEVPSLFADHGAVPVSGTDGGIYRIEGRTDVPDRIAVIEFPSLEAIDRFMADDRYQASRQQREAGATSQIFIFENAVTDGKLV